MIGSLMYLMLGTHPDITYAIGTLSWFSAKPKLTHWEAAKRILRYIQATKDMELQFDGTELSTDLDFHGYPDASWSQDPDNSHSTSGLYLLATAEPFPGLVSYRAWSHFPLRNWSTSDLAMLDNTLLGSGPSLRRLDIRRRFPRSYSVTIKRPSFYVMICNSGPGPSTSSGSTISFETTWSERERQWSDMFPPRTWWQTYSQSPL